MNWKNFKLGQKLAIGFGLLIIITMVSQLFILRYMTNISDDTQMLGDEYLKEVELANKVERVSRETMYANRGYGLSENEKYLNDGRENLNKLKDLLNDAEELADRAEHLERLQSSIDQIDNNVNKYEQLLNQTVTTNNALEEERNQMDEAAGILKQEMESFLNAQDEELQNNIRAGVGTAQIIQYVDRIHHLNETLDILNEIRVIFWKAQGQRKPELLTQTFAMFQNVDDHLNDVDDRINRSANQQLSKIKDAANSYKEAVKNLQANWRKREELNTNRDQAANDVLARVEALAEAGMEGTLEVSESTINYIQRSNISVWVGGIIVLVLGVFLAYIITNTITSPIKKGVSFAEKLSNGNLMATVNVYQNDEVGNLADSLQRMVKKIREIVANIIGAADNIAGASGQLSSSSQQVSQGASEQASSAEEVSSSMEEMVANIQQNTDNARQTETISMKTAESVKRVQASAEESTRAIREIAEKVSIIGDIAFQTNILALNAAVEAARAGEHGKGFAVVAAEVRKLAERSKVAADEIDTLSKSTVSITEETRKLMEELTPEIEKTSRLVQEIAAASIEQNSGADQVNNAIQQLNQVTQQNAAAAEEMATSSEELASQADQLKQIVGFFKIDQSTINKFINKDFKISHDNSKNKIEVAHINKKQEKEDEEQKKQNKGVNLDLNSDDNVDDDYEQF